MLLHLNNIEIVVCKRFQIGLVRAFVVWKSVNPFPHDKILDQTKLKAFADDKLNVTKMIISVFGTVENIVGKGEIAFTSSFSFSHNVFERLLSQTRQKVSLCGNELKGITQPRDRVESMVKPLLIS